MSLDASAPHGKLAVVDHDKGQYELKGCKRPPSSEEADLETQRLAEQGYVAQQFDLAALYTRGAIYADGRTPSQDDVEAYKWFSIAADRAAPTSVYRTLAITSRGTWRKVLTLKLAASVATPSAPKPFTVASDGFSLNAAVASAPHQRGRIERLCRYITRPALALERLSTNGAGQEQQPTSRKHVLHDADPCQGVSLVAHARLGSDGSGQARAREVSLRIESEGFFPTTRLGRLRCGSETATCGHPRIARAT